MGHFLSGVTGTAQSEQVDPPSMGDQVDGGLQFISIESFPGSAEDLLVVVVDLIGNRVRLTDDGGLGSGTFR